MILSAIHWNVDPVMMHLGPTTLRVVGVLCVAVLLYILAMPLFSKDKKGHRHHAVSKTAGEACRVRDPYEHRSAEERRR